MHILCWRKDGGEESHVFAFVIIEIKSLFTISFLKFTDGSRDAFHTHAFNSISWLLKGSLIEKILDTSEWHSVWHIYRPSLKPIFTYRETFHKVESVGESWALTFRGPWKHEWNEFLPVEQKHITLTHGRKIV